MNSLYQKYETLLQNTNTDFKRYLYERVAWDSRMIGIVGARGVGKTTMILQFIKENLNSKKALYVSADDLYFSQNKLLDLADEFYKYAGEYLVIDEIHKYPDWSGELKNIYDSFPTLKVVFTGSSVIDILKASSDLSPRAIIYKLHGFSFREYLKFYHNHDVDVYSLAQIVNNEVKLTGIKHPLPLFKDYLIRGYYPIGNENEMAIRLSQFVIQTLETDIPHYANLNVGTSRKLKHLLSIIAESVPFKPNFTKIAESINVSRNSLDDYFTYMEHAGLSGQLRSAAGGSRAMGRVDKVYLDNTNIIYNLIGEKWNVGNIRETFFFNQMRVNHNVLPTNTSDFLIEDYTFELAGKEIKNNQPKKNDNTFIVKDNIEFGYHNVIPLWAFGMSY